MNSPDIPPGVHDTPLMPDPESTPEVDFDAAYRTIPPWEIGRPQPALIELAPSMVGPVLDVGCGTGENALELARHGHEVAGVDSSRDAIEQARAKAAARGVDVDFQVGDAHDLAALGRRFPTVLDSALLHVITERERYAEQLTHVIESGGRLVLLEISDAAAIPYPKISQSEIRRVFTAPVWEIEQLSTSRFETHLGTFPAWLGVVRRQNR